MKLESIATILDFDPKSVRTEADATHSLGEAIYTADKRTFRFGKAAGNSSQGKLQLAPSPKTNHHGLSVQTAAPLGSTKVSVTLGATAAVAQEYAEGYMFTTDSTGAGTAYKISSHPAANASAVLELTLFDPIQSIALTTSSKVSLVHNTYNGVQEGTSTTLRGAGVPLVNISAGRYGWFQTSGAAAVLGSGTITLGAPQIAGSVAGSVTDQTDILGVGSEVTHGWADIMSGVAGEYRPITLLIR
jgi:hypothetical protein